MAKYPSQLQDKFNLRLPDGMKDAIAERAKANGRSMNSEIIQMLQYAIDNDAYMNNLAATADAEIENNPTLNMTIQEQIDYYKGFDPAKVELLKLQQKQWEETSALLKDLINKGLFK